MNNVSSTRGKVILCDTVYGLMYVLPFDIPRGCCLVATGKAPDHDDIERLCGFLDKRSGAVAVDAGANFGCFALAFAKHGAVVHAFEPQPLLANLLADSTKLNRASIVIHPKALGRTAEYAGLPAIDYDRAVDFGMVSLSNAEGQLVEVVTLDSLALPRLDLLKIDVENMEADVIAGAKETIRRCRPIIFIEWWLSDNTALERQIRALDYAIVARGERDWLCVPEIFLGRLRRFFGLR
jgi:FkbM family methyltransferase